MFPLRDDAPRWGTPAITVALIIVNVAIFLFQTSLNIESPRAQQAFIETFGAIPGRATEALAGEYPLIQGLFPLVTSIFLHGGWMHLIGNMWFLWIFGDNIEDELGHVPFLIFYVACGVLASIAYYVSDPSSYVPTIGASGAIAGVMGAYIRALSTRSSDNARAVVRDFHDDSDPGLRDAGLLVLHSIHQRRGESRLGAERRSRLVGAHRWFYRRRCVDMVATEAPAGSNGSLFSVAAG